jgi:hypothetical protein
MRLIRQTEYILNIPDEVIHFVPMQEWTEVIFV